MRRLLSRGGRKLWHAQLGSDLHRNWSHKGASASILLGAVHRFMYKVQVF